MPSSMSLRNISRPSDSRGPPTLERGPYGAATRDASEKRALTRGPRSSSAMSTQGTGQHNPAGTASPTRPQHTLAHVEEGDDNLDHRILAVDRAGSKTVGCAYYVARDGALACMEDIENADDKIFDILKLHVQPTIILYSHRVDLCEQDIARSKVLSLSEGEQPPLPYQLELRPAADFKYEQALQKLSSIPSLKDASSVSFLVPGEAEQIEQLPFVEDLGFTDERGREIRLSTFLHVGSRVSVGCAGALLTYIQRKKQSEYLSGDPAADEAYQILSLCMVSLKDTMLLDADSLLALQIFQPESQPNAAIQGPGSKGPKESLSMYGLFYLFAKTPQGRNRLRGMFMRPSTDVDIITERHNSVALFARAENRESLQQLGKSLTKIKNMRCMITLLHKGIESNTTNLGPIKSGVWASLLDFCFHVLDIIETLQKIADVTSLPLFRRLYRAIDKREFQALGKLM